jgi:hypothetical protein
VSVGEVLTPVAPLTGEGPVGVPGGVGGGGVLPAVSETLSNVDVFSAPVLWLLTISPRFAPAFIDVLVLPTVDQVEPFDDT